MIDWKENYGIMIPQDISRHPDGTAMSVVYPYREEAISYIAKNVGIDAYEKMTGAEKEKVLSEWRIADNIDINKPLHKITNNPDGSITWELNK